MCSAQADVRFVPIADIKPSFDHFIRTAKERHRNSKTEGLCGLEVDNQLNFCGLLDGEISRLFTFEDTACVNTRKPIEFVTLPP